MNSRTTGKTTALGALALTGALLLPLTACGASDTSDQSEGTSSASSLAGEVKGAGASSQEKAQAAWIDEFTATNDALSITYDAIGSGGGREKFIAGAVDFAGSDSALKDSELATATARCAGSEPVELPLYISPIAVFYNLPGFEGDNHVKMTPEVLAEVFSGAITSWDDPRITELNEGADLPAQEIVVVNRSDESGTTKNFTDYLHAAAAEQWPHEAEESWPIPAVQTGDGTSGMVTTVASAVGAIGYADASRVTDDLGTVAIGKDGVFTAYSAEAAAATLDASQLSAAASETRLVYEITRDAPNTYPLVLVSYVIGCTTYEDQEIAQAVRTYFTFMASTEGQELAADPAVAGSAPISDELRAQIMAVIGTISAE